MQCSKCAEFEPSFVTAVHLSFNTMASGFPAFDHRLHRQHHAFLQPRILILAIHVVRDLRFLVKLCADTVAHILPDDRKPVVP